MLNTNTGPTLPTNPLNDQFSNPADACSQRQVADLAVCIAAEIDGPADAVQWRDAFCHECETNECLNGTAEQLAEKIFALGWAVENLKMFNLICPRCSNAEPEVDGLWAAAEDQYERWKDARFED